jgi:hypothetical protein
VGRPPRPCPCDPLSQAQERTGTDRLVAIPSPHRPPCTGHAAVAWSQYASPRELTPLAATDCASSARSQRPRGCPRRTRARRFPGTLPHSGRGRSGRTTPRAATGKKANGWERLPTWSSTSPPRSPWCRPHGLGPLGRHLLCHGVKGLALCRDCAHQPAVGL